MTIEQALEYWKFKYDRTKDFTDIHWEADERHVHEEYVEALKVAIEALEKQIPKKSIVTKHQYILKSSGEIKGYKLTHCPYCWEDKKVEYFNSLVDKNVRYCRRCGQKLDWSDIE